MNEFRSVYTDPKSRRLAPHYVNLILDEKTKDEIRWFLVWDLLEANLSRVSWHPANGGVAAKRLNGAHRLVFDPEFGDWHILGEVMLEMRKGPYHEKFENWWQGDVQRKLLNHRWPNDEKELGKLFDWIAQNYWGAPPK